MRSENPFNKTRTPWTRSERPFSKTRTPWTRFEKPCGANTTRRNPQAARIHDWCPSRPSPRRRPLAEDMHFASVEMSMMSNRDMNEMVRDYERDGFVNAGSVIDAAEAAALIADVEPYAQRLTRGEPLEGN